MGKVISMAQVSTAQPKQLLVEPVKITFNLTEPISEEKKIALLKWCDEMKLKFPHMKAQRIANKAITHFKLK